MMSKGRWWDPPTYGKRRETIPNASFSRAGLMYAPPFWSNEGLVFPDTPCTRFLSYLHVSSCPECHSDSHLHRLWRSHLQIPSKHHTASWAPLSCSFLLGASSDHCAPTPPSPDLPFHIHFPYGDDSCNSLMTVCILQCFVAISRKKAGVSWDNGTGESTSALFLSDLREVMTLHLFILEIGGFWGIVLNMK